MSQDSEEPNLETWMDPADEARIIAMLHGETSDFGKADLEQLMDEQPELRVFHRRMKALHELVEDSETIKPSPEWRLSPGRRNAVLEKIRGTKVVPPTGALPPKAKPRKVRTWIWSLSSAAAIIAVLLVTFAQLDATRDAEAGAALEPSDDRANTENSIRFSSTEPSSQDVLAYKPHADFTTPSPPPSTVALMPAAPKAPAPALAVAEQNETTPGYGYDLALGRGGDGFGGGFGISHGREEKREKLIAQNTLTDEFGLSDKTWADSKSENDFLLGAENLRGFALHDVETTFEALYRPGDRLGLSDSVATAGKWIDNGGQPLTTFYSTNPAQAGGADWSGAMDGGAILDLRSAASKADTPGNTYAIASGVVVDGRKTTEDEEWASFAGPRFGNGEALRQGPGQGQVQGRGQSSKQISGEFYAENAPSGQSDRRRHFQNESLTKTKTKNGDDLLSDLSSDRYARSGESGEADNVLEEQRETLEERIADYELAFRDQTRSTRLDAVDGLWSTRTASPDDDNDGEIAQSGGGAASEGTAGVRLRGREIAGRDWSRPGAFGGDAEGIQPGDTSFAFQETFKGLDAKYSGSSRGSALERDGNGKEANRELAELSDQTVVRNWKLAKEPPQDSLPTPKTPKPITKAKPKATAATPPVRTPAKPGSGPVAAEAKPGADEPQSESKEDDETVLELDPAPVTRAETATVEQAYSTFSLHVSDVAFKLAKAALLEQGRWPEPAKVRVEEFVNAFDYGDAPASLKERVACRIEQAAHPLLAQRNLLRVSMRTAAIGRAGHQPLRLTVLLDKSGSMERADREASVLRAMQALAGHLGPGDTVTVVSFARQPRLIADRLPGDRASELVGLVARTPSEGGTNLEEALRLGEQMARRQFAADGMNRIVLLTDGAANLGNADPGSLMEFVVGLRRRGIAFDACGVGADGLNDAILEALTRKGDGRYYFLNRPEDADSGFVRQLAGALRPAARNVKVQVRFNPERVPSYRLLGFEKHRLRKEDFRNDKVDAAEMAAAEAGVALYQIAVDPQGSGEIGEVFVRFQDMVTGEMVERSWPIPHQARVPAFDRAPASMRLAGTAAFLAEKLRGGPAGDAVDLADLASATAGLRADCHNDPRVLALLDMVEKTRNLAKAP